MHFYRQQSYSEVAHFYLEGSAPDLAVRVARSLRQSDPREWEDEERTYSLAEFERAFTGTPVLHPLRSLPEVSSR